MHSPYRLKVFIDSTAGTAAGRHPIAPGYQPTGIWDLRQCHVDLAFHNIYLISNVDTDRIDGVGVVLIHRSVRSQQPVCNNMKLISFPLKQMLGRIV